MKKIIILMLLFVCSPSIALEDPCESESNKIQCITDLINGEKTRIYYKLNQLSTPGPSGPAGPVGEQGDKGETGPDGVDRSQFYRLVQTRHEELLILLGERGVDGTLAEDHWQVSKNTRVIYNVSGTLVGQLQMARHAVSNYNRNPDVTGELYGVDEFVNTNPSSAITCESAEDVSEFADCQRFYVFDGLAYPRFDNQLFALYEPLAEYFFDAQDGFTYRATVENPIDESGPPVVEQVGPEQGEHPIKPLCEVLTELDVCSQYTAKDEYNEQIDSNYLAVETTLNTDYDETIVIPESSDTVDASEVKVISLKDHVSYLLGADPDNPIYQRVVNRTLDLLEEDAVAILEALDETRTSIYDQYQLFIENPGIPVDLGEEYQAEQAQMEAAFEKAVSLTQTLAQNNSHAQNVMAKLGAESPLIKYLLVCSLTEIFVEYKNDQLLDLSSAEETDLARLEEALRKFIQRKTRKMANIAQSLYMEDLSTSSNLENTLGFPFGAYVDQAQDQMYDNALIDQPAIYKELYDALSANEMELETVAVFSAAVATTTGVDPALLVEEQGKKMIRRVVDKAAKKVVKKGARLLVKVLRVSGNSNVVAKILTVSLEIAIEGGLQAVESDKQKRAFDELMEASRQLPNLNEWPDDGIANAMHDWLTIGLKVD